MVAPFDPNSLSRSGRVSLGMITFTKHYDKSSPYLKKALFDNKPLDEVVFSARRTIEGETSDYLVVTLKEASVMDYEMHAAREEPDVDRGPRSASPTRTSCSPMTTDDEIEMDVYVGK